MELYNRVINNLDFLIHGMLIRGLDCSHHIAVRDEWELRRAQFVKYLAETESGTL